MAKVWGLDIPEEFANFFTDFFKLDWIDGARRITKKKSSPGQNKKNWLAAFSRLPEYSQDWSGLTEQQQNTYITDWGSNAQQAFALYAQQRWYRELNALATRQTADYFSHPIGHIHFSEADYSLKLNFEVASGDYILSQPNNIKKIQIPIKQTFEDLTQFNFRLRIRPSGTDDNDIIWYLYTIKIFGVDQIYPKYEDESEEWTDLAAGNEMSISAEAIEEWMGGEKISKIRVELEFYANKGDFWIYDANITGIDSVLGAIRLNNSNFLADISDEFDKYSQTIKTQWSLSDNAAGSYLKYDYPYAAGLDEADEGWFLTRINDPIIPASIYTDCDNDGSHLIAAVYNGRLYTSADGGASWTERQPAGAANKNWQAVAMDSDGSHLIAAIFLGRLYTSADGGASWTERQPAGNYDKQWWAMAMNDDGSHLIVGEYSGRLYTSADGGASWTERQPAGNYNKQWQAVASDDDGSHLIAAEYGGRLYTSADGGASWTERQPAGAANKNWRAVGSDNDGSHFIAAEYGGKIYESANGGASWTELKPAGGLTSRWNTAKITSNGTRKYASPFAGKILIKK